MTKHNDTRLFQQCADALIETRAALAADDYGEAAAAILDAAHSLKAWAESVRARMPKPPGPPTKAERDAQREREFPSVGAKPGPRKKESNGAHDQDNGSRTRRRRANQDASKESATG